MPTTQVEYVDGSAATNGNGLAPTSPRQRIQDAINHATGGDNRPYVRVAAGTYNENVGVSSGAVVFVVGADGAAIQPMNGDGIGAMTGGTMSLRNVRITAPNGNAANCQNATLRAYRSSFTNSSQSGIYALNCALLVDADWIDGNAQGGIYIGGGNFEVLNTIITHNTSSGGLYQVGNGTTTTFANNTIADNSATGPVGGVACSATSTLVVRNTILYRNGGAETNCMTAVVASDDATATPSPTVDLTNTAPGFKGTTPSTADSYHLLPTSPCLDVASQLYASDHDFDFETRPDSKTMMPDIGADELQR